MGTNGDLQLSKNQISARTVSFPGCIEQPSALAKSIHDNTNLTWHRKNHYSVGKNSESAYFAYFSFQGGGVFHEIMVPRLPSVGRRVFGRASNEAIFIHKIREQPGHGNVSHSPNPK